MRRERSDEPISLRFVADWEHRIAKQEELIAQLKLKRRSTAQQQQEVLAKLRNHAEVMQELTTPPPPERALSGRH